MVAKMATAKDILAVAMGEAEVWRPVVGYEGKYEVSNFGRVRSLDRMVPGKFPGMYANVRGKILTEIKNKSGYLRVNLCNENGAKASFVHRLVAMAFVDGYEKGLEVNHKDENPQNNCASNLEWCTPLYNSNYGKRNARVSASNIGRKKHYTNDGFRRMVEPKEKPIIGTDKKTGNEMYFRSIAVATRNGFSRAGISHCLSGRQKTHRGYTWRAA